MLTHSINIYKPPPIISQPVTTVYHHQAPVASKLSKFDYNVLISNLPFKKGDVVISKAIMNTNSLTKYAVYKVVDIQEIHYMAEYDAQGRPKVLHLKDHDRFDFWSNHELWVPCPPDVLERTGLVEWSKT